MTAWIRRALIAGLAVGLLGGAAVALVVPRTRDAGAAYGSAAPDEPRPAPAGDPAHPRIGAALPQPRDPGFLRLRVRGPIRIEARAADPRGGPPFAVRVFLADRVIPRPDRRPHTNGIAGHNRCAQLGRLYRGGFGWIDATNTFRPVAISFRGAPIVCTSRRPDLGGRPSLETVTRITDPRRGAAAPIQTVAWGIVGHDGRVALRLGARSVTPAPTPHGAFVAVGPASLGAGDIGAEVRYAAGAPVHVGADAHARSSVEVRAADPDGGLPHGLDVMRGPHGRWCTSWGGRVVGDRLGSVDYDLGTFNERGTSRGCTGGPRLTRRRPLSLAFGSGSSAGEPGADPLAGRVARRTLRGTFQLTGIARADVRSITIESPRDVRTVVPSRRAHAFLVVYDGTFPTGKLVLTSTLADGSRHRQTLPYLGM